MGCCTAWIENQLVGVVLAAMVPCSLSPVAAYKHLFVAKSL